MLIYSCGNLSVFENQTEAVTQAPREKEMPIGPPHMFAGLQSAHRPQLRGRVRGCGPLPAPSSGPLVKAFCSERGRQAGRRELPPAGGRGGLKAGIHPADRPVQSRPLCTQPGSRELADRSWVPRGPQSRGRVTTMTGLRFSSLTGEQIC